MLTALAICTDAHVGLCTTWLMCTTSAVTASCCNAGNATGRSTGVPATPCCSCTMQSSAVPGSWRPRLVACMCMHHARALCARTLAAAGGTCVVCWRHGNSSSIAAQVHLCLGRHTAHHGASSMPAPKRTGASNTLLPWSPHTKPSAIPANKLRYGNGLQRSLQGDSGLMSACTHVATYGDEGPCIAMTISAFII